jgi:hypothetical protein
VYKGLSDACDCFAFGRPAALASPVLKLIWDIWDIWDVWGSLKKVSMWFFFYFLEKKKGAFESFKTKCPNVATSQKRPNQKWRWSLGVFWKFASNGCFHRTMPKDGFSEWNFTLVVSQTKFFPVGLQ